MGKRNVIFLTLLLSLLSLVSAYEFCEETASEDELEILEIVDPSQSDETSWIWEPTEKLELDVKIRNKNFTTRNFEIELFLLDGDEPQANFTTTSQNPKQTTSLEKDQTKTINFSFQLKEPKYKTYFLYAKLTDENNGTICTSLKATSFSEETTIQIKEEEKIIIVKNVNGPTNITSGEKVEYTAEIINLGNTHEERVLAIAYNANLKIREVLEIIGLGVEETKNVTFNFTIPSNATSKQEKFLFTTEYNYNNETGHYYQSSDKVKTLLIQIQNKTGESNLNETTNETAAPQIEIQDQELSPTTQEESGSQSASALYLWPIAITVTLIIIIITAVFFFLKYKKNDYSKPSSVSPSAASDYVKKIQGQT